MQNLCRDIFLRSKMDDGGWILVSVIANFNRMRLLTPDQTVIVDALIGSAIVELSADGLLMRPRDNWRNWVLPVEQRDPTAHAPAAMLYPALSSTSSAAPDRQATFEGFARLDRARGLASRLCAVRGVCQACCDWRAPGGDTCAHTIAAHVPHLQAVKHTCDTHGWRSSGSQQLDWLHVTS